MWIDNKPGKLILFGLILFCQSARADEPIEYGRDIRPILAENCFACHGFDSESRAAGLRLDLRESAIDSAAIEPGSPEESLLIERIFSDDPDLMMPPPALKKHLTDDQKELLKKWIEQEAPYEDHWAFQLPRKVPLPEIQDQAWPKNPIDHFVLEKLEKSGLSPAPPAEPAAFFRRLHFDITGLPPLPEDVTSFVSQYASDPDAAVSTWIDRLMEQPAWGEHRGRYWLDAARYADTHGLHFDNYREMWPYRDWVIRTFNSNQPYDQFIMEQLAGDLLPEPTTDQMIATGFQRCNATTNEGGTIEEENLMLYAADRVQTFGWVFLGLTVNCAQCHDHKFDAITAHDYYALAAFFRNTTQGGLDGNRKDGVSSVIYLPSESDSERWNAIPGELVATKTELEAYRKLIRESFGSKLNSYKKDEVAGGVPAEGLHLYASFDEGSGEQVSSARGTALVSVGDIAWKEGKFGLAPEITTASHYLAGDAGQNWDFDDSFSYGGWVKSQNRRSVGAVIARMDTHARFRGWDLFQAESRFSVHLIDTWATNAIKVQTEKETVDDKNWQHVFVTYDGSRKPDGIKIFINGQPQQLRVNTNTLQAGATLQTATPTRVGRRRADSLWSGSIQKLRMYDRALSEEEVADLAWREELSSLLAMEPEQRTTERINQTFEFYCRSHDARYRELDSKITGLSSEYETIRNRSPLTHVQQERPNSEPQAHILMRGEYDKKGELVSASTPAALHPFAADLPRNRLGLAKWLVDPANPLTARVTVNRFWQEIFGQGVVTTPEDFGVMGNLPTHPELLDWLASDFREHDWDVKRFYKQIFSSATYRQSSVMTAEKLERDLANALLSRGPRFRMDAEMIRDTALRTSGLLSSTMFGPGVRPYQPENIWDVVGLPGGDTREYRQDRGENLYRRTLYTFWKRMAHPPNLEILNAPSREVCTVRRESTNTPLQALVTLNDPVFVEAARNLAQSVLSSGGEVSDESTKQRLDEIGMRVLSRTLSDQEAAILLSGLGEYQSHYQSHPDEAQALVKVGESPVDSNLNPATLAAWTLVCQQVLNLDEAINK